MLSGPVNSDAGVDRLTLRLVEVQGELRLAVTSHSNRQEQTHPLAVEQCVAWVGERLRRDYRNGLLGTTRRDWQLIQPAGGRARLVGHAPAQAEPPSRRHDRVKATTLGAAARDWMAGLGLVTADGRVCASMADKLRQVERYVELLGHLLDDAAFPADCRVRVADMGSGRGYLTFAAWHLLRRLRGLACDVVGVELRPELVLAANALAGRIAADGLRFVPGTIDTAGVEDPHVLIALHACNQATDHALLRGVEARAQLILVAPCCHQDLRPQLGEPAPFDALLRHGLLKERFAEWLTDGLRVLYLEAAGYRTRAIEFVGSEHTPRNLLIAAVRSGAGVRRDEIRGRIEAIQSQFGIREHPLARLLEGERGG